MKYLMILSILTVAGCGYDGETNRGQKYDIHVINNCEYVCWGSALTHKGDCTNKIHQYNN